MSVWEPSNWDRRYKHSPSEAEAVVVARSVGLSGGNVTLECVSDPRQASRDTFPFNVTTTSTLQPCCELQGATSGYVGGPCPIHGKPFYLTRHSTEPLTISVAEFEAAWERSS